MNDFKRVQIFCFFNDDSLENKIVYQLNRFLNIGFSLKFHNRCIPKNKSKMPNVQPLLTVHFFFSLKRSIANSICLFYTFLQKYFFSFWQSESTTCQKCERLFIHSQEINHVNQILKAALRDASFHFHRPHDNNCITLLLHELTVLWKWHRTMIVQSFTSSQMNMRERGEIHCHSTERREGTDLKT